MIFQRNMLRTTPGTFGSLFHGGASAREDLRLQNAWRELRDRPRGGVWRDRGVCEAQQPVFFNVFIRLGWVDFLKLGICKK